MWALLAPVGAVLNRMPACPTFKTPMPEPSAFSFLAFRVIAAALALAAGLAPLQHAQAAPGAVVVTPQVRAELLAHAPQGLAAGTPLWLGLKIEHKLHWHTYWKNPGDSGLPTTLVWSLPAGVQAGDIQWPTPSRLPIGPLMNYGYEGTLLLAVPVTLPAGWQGEQLDVKLQAQWLVCKDVCIPEEGEFSISIPARAASAGHRELFDATAARLPQTAPGVQGSAEVQGADLVVKLRGMPVAWQGQALALFPEAAGLINNAARLQPQWQGNSWTARVPLDAQRSESPLKLALVLTRAGEPGGLRVEVPVTTPWPVVAQAPALPALQELTATSGSAAGGSTATLPATLPASPPATVMPTSGAATTSAPATSLLSALLLALVGGALLNLMPCVFPVLSLKVLGFAAHRHDRRALLAGGLAYTTGVVLSFVALAGLMLALRAGGEHLGWGFQLQSPLVVAALAALFTLIGLNLAGLFELGTVLPSSLAAARARHPVADSALTGVLAVAVASPCTAPFMGAALGLALGLPAWQALLVFAVLGLGMALPYLLASAWPPLARALPRPGVWMAHFKTLMAFPMFATVVWLVWVLGQQVGIDGVAAVLGALLALAFAAWAWGSPTLGRRGRWGFGVAATLTLALVGSWAWPSLSEAPSGPTTGTSTGTSTSTSTSTPTGTSTNTSPAASGTTTSDSEGWQPWSATAVARAQSEGRSVFVDFTAAWCVTCQVNKRTTLADASVQAAFAAKQVLLMRADWTRRDSAISAELSRLQRSGVPVYALYAPGAATPVLLPELLTVANVQAAIAALPNPSP